MNVRNKKEHPVIGIDLKRDRGGETTTMPRVLVLI